MLHKIPGMPTRAGLINTITTATTLLTMLLSSCSSANKQAHTLYIAYTIPDNEFTETSKERIEKQISLRTQLFLRTNPNTRVVTVAYKYSQLQDQVTKDSQLNLGPDLILDIDPQLKKLYQGSLISAFPNSSVWAQQYSDVIKSISTVDNKLAFAPYGIYPQVSCYNNKTIKQPPKTIQELVKLGASGARIGLSTRTDEIFWTAGSTGAIPEISSLMNKKNQNKPQPKIKEWITWLRQAALYQNISFYRQQSELVNELAANNLDWISCISGDILRLREEMGEQLSIATLPNGVQTKAFAFPYILGYGLGIDSSPTQRALALSYVKANTNAVGQRQLMLRTEAYLPANKDVDIPNQSSQTLKANNDSLNEQSLSYLKQWPMILQYLETKSYLEVSKTLTELTSGNISVDDAVQALTTLRKEGKE
ncbi:extracellular solute-binding protein [Synechococcus sp. AH-551-A21]|nr:extracellular solute-binding protein [Synechococcus sp. AH-551-A21]MDB4677601.1 extracellular solute-binding protein [Synechococcus sp. AH-551-A21]